MRILLFVFLLIGLGASCGGAQIAPDVFDARGFGATGDGRTDDTAGIQRALDATGARGGGTVYLPRGLYHIAGHVQVPAGVRLLGLWASVPAHNGVREPGAPHPERDGTTLLITGSRGDESGPAAITLRSNSTLEGVVLYWPDQRDDSEPAPYPWAIAMRGRNPAVRAVELLNPFNGIDATDNERHLIRDVSGQPLRRGVSVDRVYDIGRIENVHFNPWWSMKPALIAWQRAHGEAFIFGHADWQMVVGTFCFGYDIGYHFVPGKDGQPGNGSFTGIAADDAHVAVFVEQSSYAGLLIENGQFVAMHGADPTAVVVGPAHDGNVRFAHSSFWGHMTRVADIAGRGAVSFSDCSFTSWDESGTGAAAIRAAGGAIAVRGNLFREDKAQVELGPAVLRAVVTGNLMPGALRIDNRSKGAVVISNNAARATSPKPRRRRGPTTRSSSPRRARSRRPA